MLDVPTVAVDLGLRVQGSGLAEEAMDVAKVVQAGTFAVAVGAERVGAPQLSDRVAQAAHVLKHQGQVARRAGYAGHVAYLLVRRDGVPEEFTTPPLEHVQPQHSTGDAEAQRPGPVRQFGGTARCGQDQVVVAGSAG